MTILPDVRAVEGRGGDEGIDAYTGNFAAPDCVFQFKYFFEIDANHWNKITKSLKTVCEKRKPKKWILLVATDFTPKYLDKWTELKKTYADMEMELWSSSSLKALIGNRKELFVMQFPELFPPTEVVEATLQATSTQEKVSEQPASKSKVTEQATMSPIFDRHNDKSLKLSEAEKSRVSSGIKQFTQLLKNIGLDSNIKEINVKTIAKLGNCYYNIGKYDDSAFMFELILREFPDDLRALNNKAAGLKNTDPNEALALLNTALEIEPEYVDAKLNRAATLIDNNLGIDEGIELLESIYQKNKEDEALIRNLILGYSKASNLERTLYYFHIFNKQIPNDSKVLNDVGMAYFRQNKLPEALEYFNLAIQHSVDNILSKINKAATLIGMNLNLSAIYLMETIVSSNTENAEAMVNLAIGWNNIGKPDLAIIWGLRALELRKTDYSILNCVGTFYSKIGDFEEAIRYFNKALDIKADYPHSLANKSVNLLMLGRLEEALECMNEFLKYDPNDSVILHNRRFVMRKLGITES
jgi:tetratricopeptide (TPR) repeat protein